MNDQPVDLQILRAARAAHEINRLYCRSHGDCSQPPWDDAPAWQRESAVAGVRAIADDPATTPEQSHAGWLALKQRDGWVYGDAKDPVAKRHPCIVPYDQLPPQQRIKDELFGTVVRAALGI